MQENMSLNQVFEDIYFALMSTLHTQPSELEKEWFSVFVFPQIMQKYILWFLFATRFRDQFYHSYRNSFIIFNMITSGKEIFYLCVEGEKILLLACFGCFHWFELFINLYLFRDFLGWAVLLNFLVYITIPVVLQYTGILLGIGSFAIYVNTIIGLANNKQNYFWEQVNEYKSLLRLSMPWIFIRHGLTLRRFRHFYWISAVYLLIFLPIIRYLINTLLKFIQWNFT